METIYRLWQLFDGTAALVVEFSNKGDMEGFNGKTCAENFYESVAYWKDAEPSRYEVEIEKQLYGRFTDDARDAEIMLKMVQTPRPFTRYL